MADPGCLKWSREVAKLPVQGGKSALTAFPEQWRWVLCPFPFPTGRRVQGASTLHEPRLAVKGRDGLTATLKWRLLCQGIRKE